MLSFKLLFLAVCIYTTYGSESSEELETLLSSPVGLDFIRNAIKQSYEENRLDIISTAIKELHVLDLNVTLVGSQNVYGPNGDLVEIRTVELHLPQIEKQSDTSDDSDNDDDTNIQDVLSQLRKVFDIITKLGFSMDVANEEYDKDGEITDAAYLDKDVIYAFTDGIHVVNKTIEVSTIKTVEDHIKKLQGEGSPVAVHKFDAKGQFLSEGSTIVPEYSVSVVSEDDEVTPELLEVAQKGLATIFLKYQHNQGEIPSKLAEYLSLKYPKFDYIVLLNEPQGWYISKEYKINLQVDLITWESDEDQLVYSIFVQKKDEKSASI